ncbi:MAG TPA: NfeD family protein [Azospirillum sp.]|nr:NfeD family protein [Azospirillum sp.]
MIEFWHWWVLAVLLAVIETVVPAGASFLWLGGAASAVGLALAAFPALPWQIQFLLFAALAIAAVVGARVVARRPAGGDDGRPGLNRRAEGYIGTVHTLATPIVNGRGRAVVGDTHWTVEGPDLPAGASVRVVGTDGAALKVEKA